MSQSQDWNGEQVGDYRLLRRLGGGSFGEVYLAKDLHKRNLAAVKLIKAPLVEREALKAFLNEARSMRLRHPHIVPLLDFGLSSRDLPFLVMEYVDGGTLRDRYPKGDRMPLDTVVDVTTQLASALQYAHDQHLIHRDVKPENMLCRTDGTVLLSDFGIASVAHASGSASISRSFGGTLPYMAPEQHAGKPRPASDQYALAVVVYEWLAGTRPFQGTFPELISQHLHAPPPSLLNQLSTLPAEVEQVVFKALSKEPQERFARVDDFALALQAASRRQLFPLSPSSSSPESSALLEWKPSVLDQVLTPDPQRAGELFSTELLSGMTNQPVPGQVPPITPSKAAMTTSEGSPVGNASRSSASIASPVQPRRILSRRMLFTSGLLLLLLLSGSGLWYFISTSGSPVLHQLSPIQSAVATATANAQGYATETARQGVMFGFDAARTHDNPYEHTLSPATVSGLQLLWTFSVGGEVRSSPAVAGGMVYVGSGGNKFYAFDAACRADCQPLWSFKAAGEVRTSPAVAGGMVYIGSYDGTLYAFDATCRNACLPLWSFATGGSFVSSPVVANGIVYTSTGGTPYAFDATCRKNCQPLRTFSAGSVSPAVAGGIVYVGSYDHNLYAFDVRCRKDCQPLWSFATGGEIFSSPAISGGLVYVSSEDRKLYAFDASCRQACQPLWSFVTGGEIFSSPAVAGGVVYVGSGDHKLYAFAANCRKACQPLWSFATGGEVISSPTVAGEVVYVGSADHKLYAFDATCRQACQPLWSYATEGGIYLSSPAVANGMVYIGAYDGKLYAFGLVS